VFQNDPYPVFQNDPGPISNIQQKIAAFCLIPLAIVGLSICIRPLQAILFHSEHVYYRERIHFHRAFRENSKKAFFLLEAGTIHLAGVGKVLFLSSFASAGGD